MFWTDEYSEETLRVILMRMIEVYAPVFCLGCYKHLDDSDQAYFTEHWSFCTMECFEARLCA